ncbi:MAG TPA: bacteriohemerythrin [Gammaproteobacteria bacterium]|nr:bacteriohemerythrin [Gammaproteobacteria bacterium]
MKILLMPAISLMNHLRFRTKFILLFLLSTTPLLIFGYELLGTDQGGASTIFNGGILMGGLAALSYLYLALFVAIRDKVQQLQEISSSMADGDMSHHLELDSHDELGEIASSVNNISNGVGHAIDSVLGTVEVLAETSDRLAELNQRSGENVSIQADSIEQAAAAMTEMTATVQEVARNSAQAATAAKQADDAIASGQRVVAEAVGSINSLAGDVQQAVEAIGRLENHSDNINGILDIIRDIAEQTNLLALNAAIEAARAGEQGRGFAVVADEVRSLAKRTQESTLEIQNMIEKLQHDTRETAQVMLSSGERAKESVEASNGTCSVLDEIAVSINSISEMNELIATAVEQQSVVAEDINGNINRISQAVEGINQDARHAGAESVRVAAMAAEVRMMLERFKINEKALQEKRQKQDSNTLFRWDNSFVIGVAEIDRQHKLLVDLVNELYYEVSQGAGHEMLGRFLDGLVDYTKTHFTYEEGLLAMHGYDELEAHQAKHKKLVSRIMEFHGRVSARDETVIEELLQFLKDWLAKHIKETDKRYASFLNEKGVQ